jgi:hypothetical protein
VNNTLTGRALYAVGDSIITLTAGLESFTVTIKQVNNTTLEFVGELDKVLITTGSPHGINKGKIMKKRKEKVWYRQGERW